MPNSFVFDQRKCTGCQACQLACTIENDLTPDRTWRRVTTYNPRRHPAAPLFHLSLACNHCEAAPCMAGCPALAYSRDPETGAVLLDPQLCIGCRYCAWACPFDAPRFDHDAGVMTKCTFCNHRLLEGLVPACAELCPTGALSYADLPDEEITHDAEGFPRTEVGPRLKIVPAGRSLNPPEMTAPAGTESFDPAADTPPAKISLRSEWPLAVFTSLAALLVAVWTASLVASLTLDPLWFGGAAVAGLVLSAVHLGRKERAYRAVANLAGSWLSREILLVSLFAGLATVFLVWRIPHAMVGSMWLAPHPAVGWSVALLGFAGLLAVDRVYQVTLRPGAGWSHSAGVFLTALYLAGVWAHVPLLAGAAGTAKLFLYLTRKRCFARSGRPWRPTVSLLRVIGGFVVPLAALLTDPARLAEVALAGALLGEGIDRCEYYAELEIMTPARQMVTDLTARLQRAEQPGSNQS